MAERGYSEDILDIGSRGQQRTETEKKGKEKESLGNHVGNQSDATSMQSESRNKVVYKAEGFKETPTKLVKEENCIVSNLFKDKEINDEGGKTLDAMDLELETQHQMEDNLRMTRDHMIVLEKRNSDLIKTAFTKEKELQNMESSLTDVNALKDEQTKQLEELQSTLDRLGEETAIERNLKNRALLDIEQMVNESKEKVHEGALYIIKHNHCAILSDFDKQMAEVKRTKPKGSQTERK